MFSNKYKSIILIILCCLFSVSCAYFSAHGRAYKKSHSASKRGNYEQAVYACADALRIKSDYEEVELIMDAVFPKAIRKHHKKIEGYKYHQSNFYWDKIVDELSILSDLKLAIEDLGHPKSDIWLSKANVRNYLAEIKDARQNSADGHYQAGIRFKLFTDRESQKLAAQQFQITLTIIENYKDSRELYQNCKNAGTTRIAILPFANKSGQNRYGSIGENVSSSIRSALLNDSEIMEFVNIIDRQQIDQIIEEQKLSQSGLVDSESSIEIGKLLGVHQIISGEVTFLTASKPNHIKNTQRYTKEVAIGTETYTDDDGKEKTRNIYGEVKATVTVHSISASAQVQASYQVLHAETAEVLNSEMVSGSRQFDFTWATFNGDKRALSNDVRKLTRKSEKAAPSKEQLALDAITNLNEKIIRKIKKVYK